MWYFRLILLLLLPTVALAGGIPPIDPPPSAINLVITVYDTHGETPIDVVRLVLRHNGKMVGTATTNALGRGIIRDIQPGLYSISARRAGYIDYSDSLLVDSAHLEATIRMSEVTHEVVVTAQREFTTTTVEVKSGNQIFEGTNYHAPPAARIAQLVQQNLAGAVRAPTGEVHVRGQHGEFTYYVDGIPIPLGVFGGLNEVVDPKVIDHATFYTGGFPAEYGGQMASIIDVQTHIPTGGFHLDASTYIGSYLTSSSDSLGSRVGAFRDINSNGQSVSLSDHVGNLGFFLSGSRQETDRRIDQPVPQLSHNHGFDYFLYGKGNYVLNTNDYLAVNLNYGVTHTEIPFDPSSGQGRDLQHTYNAFQTFSYFHTISSDAEQESNFFVGGYARQGGLEFTPDVADEPKQFIGSDTTTGYVVAQNRSFNTLGIRSKYDARTSHEFGYAAGFDVKGTWGVEDFRFIASDSPDIHNSTKYSGSDIGIFAQSEFHPAEWGRLDVGLRYDMHNDPETAITSQVSPRAKLSLFPDESSTLYLYYGRLFIPMNIEGLHSVATIIGSSAAGTLPQRENQYEAGYVQNWGFGLTSKLSLFYKDQSPGVDDQTLGSSTIKVNVNINEVKVSGIELALNYSIPSTPFSAYLNGALIHAYGTGPVSGGFLPADTSTTPFDLDHDQRLSGVIGINYQPENWFANVSATYGSGLANGNDNATFSTGLFDFNQAAHTTPSWIINVAAGYTFHLGNGSTIEPSLYVTNLFDHDHLVKGAFFSGASFEERRNVVLRVGVGL